MAPKLPRIQSSMVCPLISAVIVENCNPVIPCSKAAIPPLPKKMKMMGKKQPNATTKLPWMFWS